MICKKCTEDKPTQEFRPNKRTKTGFQAYCISCDKQFQKDWYQKNKKEHIERARLSNIKIKETNNKFIIDYLKANPCVKCGEKDIVVLDFDHISDKRANVSRLRTCSLNTIKKEISKCQVLCANCHRRKTAKECNSYKLE